MGRKISGPVRQREVLGGQARLGIHGMLLACPGKSAVMVPWEVYAAGSPEERGRGKPSVVVPEPLKLGSL